MESRSGAGWVVPMSDDVIEEIEGWIEWRWEEMHLCSYFPALNRMDEVHDLAETERDKMSDREFGIYNAGVLRGLELARDAVEEMENEDE